MTQKESSPKNTDWNKILIILFSTIGLIACIAALFPYIRQMIMDLAAQIYQREASTSQSWLRVLLSYAMGGIFIILFFDYCTLTKSGKALVHKTKQEIKDSLSEIDFRSLIKPVLLLFGVYLLGIMTIIRANFSYIDDIWISVAGYRVWYDWSRYVIQFLSYIIHPDISLTDISPLPQLLAAFLLSISSVLLVYVIGKRKINIVLLLATIPLALFPFNLECLSFKYGAPYAPLSLLACIFPFLFIARKNAFIFCSFLCLLIICMTHQASAGVYMLIVIILSFQDWNSKKKTNKEIFSFIGISAFSFCFSLLFFKFFLMKPLDSYASNTMHQVSNLVSGILNNIKGYAEIISSDFGIIWKTGILLVLLFFIIKSICQSKQNKLLTFFVSIIAIGLSFILSYGIYLLLETPMYTPRALTGFCSFLAIMSIYVVLENKKIAIITVLALNWCFFVFAFSYGNALADQKRYETFRSSLMLHDLNSLYPENTDDMTIQISNAIGFTPVIENIAKHNPVIKRLVPVQIKEDDMFSYINFLNYNNFGKFKSKVFSYSSDYEDFKKLDLPVVLDSYYHTIKSDGNRILVVLKDSSFQ